MGAGLECEENEFFGSESSMRLLLEAMEDRVDA